MQRIIISTDLDTELSQAIADCEHDRIFILTDETTHRLCLPLVKDFDCLKDAEIITIGASDVNKTLESTARVWEKLQKGGATRFAHKSRWRNGD